jgi:Mn2+/Fe2+ NRAMP family transporter
LAHPDLAQVARGIFFPTIQFNREFLAILVAIIGTSLSAYIYTWQSNEEVEEKIAAGRHTLRERDGTTQSELKRSLWDVLFGMLFSNLIMFFTMLTTESLAIKLRETTLRMTLSK